MKSLLYGFALCALLTSSSFAQAWVPSTNDIMTVTGSDGSYHNTNVRAEVAGVIAAQGYRSVTSTPSISGTGTPTIVAASTDLAGQVTAGASATSVVISFAVAEQTAPFCVVTSQTGGITSFAYAITGSAITVTQSATSGNLINYSCVPR